MPDKEKEKHSAKNCTECASPECWQSNCQASDPALVLSLKDKIESSSKSIKSCAATLSSILDAACKAGSENHFPASVSQCLQRSKYGLNQVSIENSDKQIELNTVQSLTPSLDDDVSYIMKNDLSFSKYEKQRLDSCYLSHSESKRKTQENPEKVVSKDHVGPLPSYSYDSETFRAVLTSKTPGDAINWSELARECNVANKNRQSVPNGGAALCKYAKEQGIDHYDYNTGKTISGRDITSRVRRYKRRLQHGCPYPSRNPLFKVKERISEMKKEGQLEIGEVINSFPVQQNYVNSANSILSQTLAIPSRKIPLQRVILSELSRQLNLGVLVIYNDSDLLSLSDDEIFQKLKDIGENCENFTPVEARDHFIILNRTIHLKFWHDHGEIAGHSNLVVNVTVLHDNAVHIADSQYLVEKPCIYILGWSGSNVANQVEYSRFRLQDLPQLSSLQVPKISAEVRCIPRFCVVDSPARCFECGTQIAGNYRCPCGLHCESFPDLGTSLLSPHRSLEDIQTSVLAGVLWQTQDPFPFRALKKSDLEKELYVRKIHPAATSYYTANKADLDAILVQELKGVQRVPAILTSSPQASLKDIGCESYEVPCMEFMHDMCIIVEHVMCELPLVGQCSELSNFILSLRRDQQKFRAVDNRRYCAKMCVFSQGLFDNDKLSRECLRLLQVLGEIIEIGYSLASSRCAGSVLRFHNLTFLLGMYMKIIFGESPMSMIRGKMYGLYFHNLTSHAPIVYRVIAIRSLLPEQDESVIWKLRQITNNTSSRRPLEVTKNAMMRASYHLESEEITKQNCDRLVAREAQHVKKWGRQSFHNDGLIHSRGKVRLYKPTSSLYRIIWRQVKARGMPRVMGASYFMMRPHLHVRGQK